MNNKKLLGTLCGIGAAVCYGTNPLGARLYAEGMSPSSVLFWRFGLAWLIIAAVMLGFVHNRVSANDRDWGNPFF